MKTKLLHTALVIGLLSTATSRADEASWKKVAPAGARFQALMPGALTHNQQSKKTPFGTMTIHTYMAADENTGVYYGVTTCELPPALRAQAAAQPDEFLDAFAVGAAAGAKGKLTSQKKITMAGHSGRELDATVFDGAGTLKIRVILADGRVYAIMVLAPKGAGDAPARSRFLDSFKIATAAPRLLRL